MSRYTGPRLRIVRRLGGVELPGLVTPRELPRQYPPGQHGPTQRVKLSDYAIRLREKQKLRYHYGVGERQFVRYVASAKAAKGNTGERLLSLLESRLDSIIYRAGYARTNRAARQMVRHGHVLVNGRKQTIPSFSVGGGSVVEISEKSKHKDRILAELQGPGQNPLPDFLEREEAHPLRVRVKNAPEGRDCGVSNINESLVVELYAVRL
ncbi:MAG: 30S ribosomal protein S4 [Deltaproteobacteria bacterium]|nr:30S ribosomal protein S4 [Deltaproteobacteria bacterium]